MADEKKTMEAVQELHKLIESKNAETAEYKEKFDKINVELDKQEKSNQEITVKFKEKEKSELELKEKFESLEKIVSRPGNSTDDEKTESKKTLKAFYNVMHKGIDYLRDEARDAKNVDVIEGLKYLRTDNNVQGGYLAPAEYVNEIIKKITEVSPIRNLARVRSTSKGSIEIPSRATLLSAAWVGEGASSTNNNSTYGMEKIPVNKLVANIHITTEMLSDSAFNMEAELTSDTAESFANTEGTAFVTGDGIAKPFGFASDAVLQAAALDSGIANSYDADALIEITGELKTGYNPVFGLNRTEIAFIRTLKDGLGQYLWNPGIAAGIPNTIVGFPYIEMPDMADRGADEYPVVFADFFRGYTIADGASMTVVRDVYTLAADGKIRFITHKRTGGQVTLDEAFKLLKCSV